MSLSTSSPNVSQEKGAAAVVVDERIETLHDRKDTGSDSDAYVLDANKLGGKGHELQTTHDGKTVLIPQPSSDPNDPLNWDPLKKHVILMVITVCAFLPDFGSSMGIVTLLPQAA